MNTNRHKQIPWLFLLLAWILLLNVRTYAEANWKTYSRGYAAIHFHPEDEKNVRIILETLDNVLPIVSLNLGLTLNSDFDIYLASRPAEFGELTGWRLPAWSQGVAQPQRRRVVLKSPRFSGSQVDLGRAAVHEFIHILLYHEAGYVPIWLNEGLAVMLSGEGYFNQMELPQAAFARRLISFEEMETVLKFSPAKANLAYQQALSATQYLVKEFGWEQVRVLMRNIRSGLPFDQAFRKATGLWPDEFENEWGDQMRSQYRFAFLKDLNHLLFMIFGPLVIIGGVLMWFRRRRTIRRWDMEEKYYDYDDD